MQYYDAITNPRWQTAANSKKIATSAYLRVKCTMTNGLTILCNTFSPV